MKKVMSMVLVMALTLLSGCGIGQRDEDQLNRYTVSDGMYAISLPGEWTEEDNMGIPGMLSLERKDGAGVMVIGVAKGEPLLGYGPGVSGVDELLEYTSAMFLNRQDDCRTVLSDDEPIASNGFADVVAKEGLVTQEKGSYKIFVQCAETEKAYYIIMLSVNERYNHYEKYEALVPSLKKQLIFEELGVPVKEGLSDTLRWFNACYAVVITQNSGDVNTVAGFEAGSFYQKLLAAVLERDWGITDRESLKDMVDWLVTGGHNQAALEELGLFGPAGMSREELIAAMDKADAAAEDKISRLAAFEAKKAYGEKAIAGWDLSRAMQLIGWGYVAGYYTYEEAMDESLEMAKYIQLYFGSWEDFYGSYLYGYSYWSGEDLADTASTAYGRKQIYEKLKADGVFGVDWKLNFVKDW